MKALRLDSEQLRYRALIGVGGIGSGTFFAIRGNQTLGREESRLGRFLDRRDYCKLHIITHYVKTLLGADFLALPVGCVGEDSVGKRLLQEMADNGLDTRFVKVRPDHPTLYSFCFLYPDGAGGNLTTDNSACSTTDASSVAEASAEFRKFRRRGIALAAPEVPLPARAALLALGRDHDFLNVATFSSEDILVALEQGLMEDLGLLAMNRHEAATLAGLSAEECRVETIVESVVSLLSARYPKMLLSITAGPDGSWTWDGNGLLYREAVRTEVRSTAGAGDAHLAALIVGIAAGLNFGHSHELASLLASFSVTSPHTIHPDAGRAALREFASQNGVSLSPEVNRLLEE